MCLYTRLDEILNFKFIGVIVSEFQKKMKTTTKTWQICKNHYFVPRVIFSSIFCMLLLFHVFSALM